MACAQTGSGKTAGFLFPVIIKMISVGGAAAQECAADAGGGGGSSYGRSKKCFPTALILAPTREVSAWVCFGIGIWNFFLFLL